LSNGKQQRRNAAVPLYNQLKTYRTALGVNQQELGRLAGVSRQTISLIERGDYSPSVALALRLAKLCHCKVEDIFNYEEEHTDGYAEGNHSAGE
jgi:putative transcriptional regulator